MNLFSRLYKYQASPERGQLENFCTESVCDLLNRLSSNQQQSFLQNIGITIHSKKFISWRTQYSIIDQVNSSRFPDLVGIIDGVVRYLVEVKINASFTKGEDKDGNVLSQLSIYDNWLSEHSQKDTPSSLILLTHETKPISDFEDLGSTFFKTKDRKIIYWQSIYEHLQHFSSIAHAEDFGNFLIEKGLAMDLPTRQDFAVIELLYSGAGKRFEGLMKMTHQKLKDKYQNNTSFNWNAEDKWRNEGSKAYWEAAICWSYVIFANEPYSYFYWGIQFPAFDSEWDILTEFPQTSSAPQLVFGYVVKGEEEAQKMADAFTKDRYETGVISSNEESSIIHLGLPLSNLLNKKYNVDSIVDWLANEIDRALIVINNS